MHLSSAEILGGSFPTRSWPPIFESGSSPAVQSATRLNPTEEGLLMEAFRLQLNL